MPSARIRFAGEAAFLILVALGLGLAGFDPIVIAVVMFVVLVLVGLLERASAKEATRSAGRAQEEPPAITPAPVEGLDVEAAQPRAAAGQEQKPEPKPEPAVSERSARAILASAPPPLSKEERKARPNSPPRAEPPPPPSEPETEPAEPAVTGPPKAWNLWELQRAVRDSADDDRHQEWSALLIHLREFANADGDLPLEFDGLVRESFGPLLVRSAEPAAAP